MTWAPGAQAAFDDPVAAVLRPQLHIHDMCTWLSECDGVDLLDSLQLLNGNLGNQQRTVADFRGRRHAPELAGAQNIAGIGKCGGDADGAGLLVHLAIDEDDVPPVWVRLAIGQRKRERQIRSATRAGRLPTALRDATSARYSLSLMEK